MPPIQSRRSRKQRETVYINGQHTNLLKEISNPGPDGTVPLLNFLENTDRFIADTSQLQIKVAGLEQELEKYKNMYDDFNKMVNYMKQLSHFLTPSLQINNTTEPNNNELLSNTDNLSFPNFPELSTENKDIFFTELPITKFQTNYFEPNTSKKNTSSFPHFNHNIEHYIKIAIEPNTQLQQPSDNNDNKLLTNANTRKIINANDMLSNIIPEPNTHNLSNVEILLPNSRNRFGQDLYDISHTAKNMSNQNNNSSYNLLSNSDQRQYGIPIDLKELYHHNMINTQLENDAEEIAITLLKHEKHRSKYTKSTKNKKEIQSKISNIYHRRNTQRERMQHQDIITSNLEDNTNDEPIINMNKSSKYRGLDLSAFKSMTNSIRSADLNPSWSMTDKDMNHAPISAGLNLQRFKLGKKTPNMSSLEKYDNTNSIYSYTRTPNLLLLNHTRRNKASLMELYSKEVFSDLSNLETYENENEPLEPLYRAEIEELNNIRDLLLNSDD